MNGSVSKLTKTIKNIKAVPQRICSFGIFFDIVHISSD